MDKEDKYLMRLCKNILAGRFNYENYSSRNSYYGEIIETTPVFCSYGTIGFAVQVFHCHVEVQYDWEMEKLTIDGMDWKEWLNESYLEYNDIICHDNREYELYTDAGEDMIINLEVCDKEHLQEYIDDFDENEHVMMWWREGEDKAHELGVPFTNIRDHYNDYESFIDTLQAVCDGMPY